MNDLSLVRLPPDDWGRYRALRIEALTVSPDAFASSLSTQRTYPEAYWRKRLTDALTLPSEWLIFADHRGTLVGMIGAIARDDPTCAELMAFFVTPGVRHLGIGTRLLDRTLEEFRNRPPVSTIELRVNERQSDAVRLYRRSGFAVVAVEPESAASSVPRTLVMRRELREQG